MLKNIFFMALSMGARLISGAVLLFILARVLGPKEYGVMVYNFSVSLMLLLIVEYGYTTYIIKCGGDDKASVPRLMAEAFATKFYLMAVYIFVCLILFWIGFLKIEDALLFSLLALSSILMSYGDFINIGFRGIQAFHKESWNVIGASVIHFCIVIPVLLMYKNSLAVALGFVISRGLFLALSLASYRRCFGAGLFQKKLLFSRTIILGNLKSGFTYAADNGLVNVRSYLDIVLINWMLGPTLVGLYQAGMNIVKAIENLAPIFANVYLPRLSSLQHDMAVCGRNYLHLVSLMFVAGLSIFLIFLMVNEHIVTLLLGYKYAEISSLFPLLGIFLFCRFITVAQGVMATAFGLQRYRMYAGALSLLLLAVSSVSFIHWFQLAGAIMANIAVTIFLLLFFSLLLYVKKIRLKTGLFPVACFVAVMTLLTSILARA
jgi:Membrane protein involved in the export of O-antigen and teichoic acid